MNAEKLATMPFERIWKACVVHAAKAIEYKEAGNARMFELHAALLDQCAEVGRANPQFMAAKQNERLPS